MKSKFIFPIISIIQILMGVGLLLGVFLDPVGLMQPFFKGEITADLIFWTQGIIDVSAMHMIGVGLLIFSLWRLKFDNESNKKIFLGYSIFGGVVLLVALFNHLFRGGGPPIPILILIVSATALGLYGSRKAID